MAGIVNWVQMWQMMLLSTHRIECCNTGYWDNKASSYNENTASMKDLTQKQLDKLRSVAGFTILEVGAGTGRITLPLAREAKHVTALEPSANMMAILKATAQTENINNLGYINERIEDTDTAAIEPHDIVLASLSLLIVDVEKALLKMNDLALKGVYLFVSAR